MGCTRVLPEGSRIDEETWDKVDATSGGNFTMLGELILPAILRRARAERAFFTGEGRRERTAAVLELVGVLSVVRDVLADGRSVVGRTAGQDSGNNAKG